MDTYNKGKKVDAFKRPAHKIRLIDNEQMSKLYKLRDDINEYTGDNAEKYTNQEREDAFNSFKRTRSQIEKQAMAKLQSIVDGMTDYEQQFLKASEKFFWEYSGKQINETSMELNGYPKATVKNYFPISTDKNYTKAEIEGLKMDQTLEGRGSLKARVGAKNPIYLENINDVVQRQSDFVSKYAGLAIPIRNFNKVYNFNSNDYRDSVKESINLQKGAGATKYIENLLTDLQGNRNDGTFFDTLKGNFAASTLTANLGVAMKQASSFPTAAAVLGPDAIKHVAGSWDGLDLLRTILFPVFGKSKTTQSQMELINKYSPLIKYRNKGNSTQELGDLQKQHTVLDKFKLTRLLKKFTFNWIQDIDTTTVTKLWKAAEYRVSKDTDLKYGTDEYYKEVAKWFNKAVEETQPNYTTLQRPDILRNPNALVKALTMFKTQSFQNQGIIVDSFGNLRAKAEEYKANPTEENKAKVKEARGKFNQSVGAVVTGQMLFAVMGFVALVIKHRPDKYRDENGDLTPESIASGIMKDFGSALSGMFLGGSEAYDFINSVVTGGRYYGISVPSVEAVSDTLNDIQKLVNTNFDDFNKWFTNAKRVAEDGAILTGLPLKNYEDLLNGIYLRVKDMLLYQNPLALEAGYERTSKQYSNKLYEALESGNQDMFEKTYNNMLNNGYSEEDIYNKQGDNNDAAEIVTTKYKEGDIDFDTAVKYYTELGMDEDDAYFKTVKMTTDFQSPYALCVSAISSEDTGAIIDAVNGMLDHGYTKDKLKDYDMPDSIKEQYIDLYHTNKTEAASLKSAILTYYQACGMSREDAAKKVDKWVE
jgi:hypothetical protein